MKHTVTGGTGNWTRIYTTGNDSNRLSETVVGSSTPEEYAYDNRGNITGGLNHLNADGVSMEYNAENRLEKVIINSSRTAYYQYDNNGQRVRKAIVDVNSNTNETRKYVGEWEEYESLTGLTINVKRETLHISDDNERIALIDTRTDGTGVEPAQLLRYQYSNHLGTATLELDDGGAIISYEEYYPYGSTSFQSGRSGAEVSLKRYRYCASERDKETGLYYFGARYYIPWLARWSSLDPINNENYNLAQGYGLEKNMERQFLDLCASSYEYCYDNPVRFNDANGEQANPLQMVETEWNRLFNTAEKKTTEAIDKSFKVALIGAAYKKAPELLTNDLFGTEMSEERKQKIFDTDFEATVGILLYEFATGTGEQHRDFYYSKDKPNSFANKVVEGYVLKDVVEGIYSRVREEFIDNNKDWNWVKDNSFYGFGIEFSPDQTGFRIDKSIKRHIESNSAQFFIGGVSVKAFPRGDTKAYVQIENKTSRESAMLHLANRDYSVGNLRTISQTIHFNINNLDSTKTVDFEPSFLDNIKNKIKWLKYLD